MTAPAAPVRIFSIPAFFGALFFLAAFGCSLFFRGYQDIIYAPAVMALLGAALLAVLPGCWTQLQAPRGWFVAAVGAFWLYVTLSLSWSTVPFASLVTYLIILTLPLVFFTVLLARDRVAWLAQGAGMIGMAMLVLAGWAIVQVVFLPEQYYRAHHPLPNPNSLGALFNLGFFAAIAGALWPGRMDSLRGMALAVAAFFFAGILATESRSVLLALLVALPLLMLLVRVGWRRAALVGGVLLAVFAVMQAATGGEVMRRFAETHVEGSGEDTLGPRFALWDATVTMLRERPLTGTGLGTFYLYYPAYRPPLTDDSAGSWVHNDPLQFAVEMGVAAPVLFYLILLVGLGRTIRAWRATRDPALRMMIAAPFCALLTLAIDAHVSFPFYLMPITLCAGLLLAAWFEATRHALAADDRRIHFHGWQQSFVGIMAIAAAAMIAIMAASSAAGMFYLHKAREALNRAQIENFILLAEKADRYSPPSFIDAQLHTAGLYIDMLVPPAGLMYPHEQVESRDQALALLAHAEKMNPPWAEINYKRGRLYAVTAVYGLTPGGEKLAEEQYQIAIRKNPMHYRAREELARIMLARGEAADAYDLLAAGLEYPLPNDIRRSYLPLLRELQGLAAVQKKYREQTE